LGSEQIDLLKSLSADPTIQEVVNKHDKKLTISHLSYFWDHLDRISQSDYIPTHEDLLRVTVHTSGPNSSTIYIGNRYIEFFDDIIQPEQTQWEQFLSDPSIYAIIYFVAVDKFDVKDEESNRSKMETSRLILSKIVSSIKEDVDVIIFLNRIDLFQIRLQDPAGVKAFQETFPECEGTDHLACLEFIWNLFSAVGENNYRRVKCHQTCTLDREWLVVVWRCMREYLLVKLDNMYIYIGP